MNGKKLHIQQSSDQIPSDLFSYIPKFVSHSQKNDFINDLRDILQDLRCKLQIANSKTNFFLYAALSQKTNTKVTSIRLALENKQEKRDPDEVKVLEAIRNSSKNFSNKYINDMNSWRSKAELLEQEIEKYQELLEKVKDTKVNSKSLLT
jgi:uncharacterized membrane protein YgaE (UPF0421/DUF939 family)